MTTTLKNIAPGKIKKNPENPRMHFREPGLNRLAESIEEAGGVLVPVYVYPDKKNRGTFFLIDGERRWRMASKLGLPTIPAIVRDKAPGAAENIVEMFNIHKVREDWEDMPTARALQEVMTRKGTTDPQKLKELTGLSKEQIARYRLILDLPKRYQKLIEDRKLPMNFFVELERNVIEPLEQSRLALAKEFTPAKLRAAFVGKRDRGAAKDVVDFRLVKPIIERAAADAGAPDQPSIIDRHLRKLFTDSTATIQEVYDESVATAVELDKLVEQATELPKSFAVLLKKAKDDERAVILDIVRTTRDALERLLPADD